MSNTDGTPYETRYHPDRTGDLPSRGVHDEGRNDDLRRAMRRLPGSMSPWENDLVRLLDTSDNYLTGRLVDRDTIDYEAGIEAWWEAFRIKGQYNPATRAAIAAAIGDTSETPSQNFDVGKRNVTHSGSRGDLHPDAAIGGADE